MISLTERSIALAAIPHEERPKCQPACTLLRVYDTATGPTWRCEKCLMYFELNLKAEYLAKPEAPKTLKQEELF